MSQATPLAKPWLGRCVFSDGDPATHVFHWKHFLDEHRLYWGGQLSSGPWLLCAKHANNKFGAKHMAYDYILPLLDVEPGSELHIALECAFYALASP